MYALLVGADLRTARFVRLLHRRAGACSRRGSLPEVNETKRLITVLTKCVTETRREEANLRFARLSTMFQEERSRRGSLPEGAVAVGD